MFPTRSVIIVVLFMLIMLFMTAARTVSQVQCSAHRAYIENKGQIGDQDGKPNHDVRFLILRPGLNIQLRTNGFSYDSYVVERCELPTDSIRQMPPPKNADRPREEVTYHFHRVDIELVDANPAPVIESREASADYLNYYTHITEQANGEQGAMLVRGYGRITYHDVWPGIDLEWFIDEEGNPEYQFMVRPGGDPSRIQLRYHGANGAELLGNAIMIHVNHGPIREHIPKSFYAGSGLPVDVRYRKVGHNTFGVAVPSVAMAVTETLVIDPTPERLWGSYYGGTGVERCSSVAVTSTGDIVQAGESNSAAGIATTGSHQQTWGGDTDCYLAVFTFSGALRWATYYGGSGIDASNAVTVTPTGDIVLAGYTASYNGIATVGAHQPDNMWLDGFLAVFTDAGVRRWATYYGGSEYDDVWSVAMTTTGDIVIAGGTQSTDGIATAGAHQLTLRGAADAFLAVFTDDGVRRWGTYYGGSGDDQGVSVVVSTTGEIVLAGDTDSFAGIATAGVHQQNRGGEYDAFVAVFTNAGVRRWCTYYGGPGEDRSGDVSVASTGDIVLAGNSNSTTGIATTGSHQQARGGSGDAFVAVLTDAGVQRWGTHYGGTASDQGSAVAVTSWGDIVLAGTTKSSTGIATTGSFQETFDSRTVGSFIAMFTEDGVRRWGTYHGGTAGSVALTPSDDIVLVGSTAAIDGITTEGSHQQTHGGSLDAFISVFRTPCAPPAVTLTSAVAVNKICLEQVSTLTASAGSGTRVQWTQPQLGTITNAVTDTTASIRWTSVGVDTVRVRVMRTADSTCFRDTMIVVTVNALPTPAITSATGLTMCAGDSVTLDAGVGFVSYAWFEGTTPAGTGRFLVTKKAASYTVQVSNATCSDTSSSVTTTIIALPTVGITETVAGTLTASTNVTQASYQWYDASTDPWTAITGATSSTFVPSASGRYGVEVTNTATGCRNRSAAFDITLGPTSTAPVITALTPNATVCLGDNATLRVRATGGRAPYGYQWADGATALPSTDTTVTWTPVRSTTVTCIVIDADGKRDTATITVTVRPRPVAAITEDPAGTLTAEPAGADSYQWLDALRMPLTGATSATYQPSTSGIYYAVVTQQGCVDTSDAATYTAPPNGELKVSDYNFGSVPVDDLINGSGGHVGSVRVQNLTGTYLELTGATTDDPSTFVVPQQWPRRLNNGDTAEIAVRYMPTEKRPYSTVITVATSTSFTGNATISGTGRDLQPDERVTQVVLRPSRAEVEPGDTISVKLLINVEWPQSTAGLAGRFISTIQWDNRVLEPLPTPGMGYDTTGTYALARVRNGIRQQNQSQLFSFRFRAKQGEVDSTAMFFGGATGFIWQDDRKSYAAMVDSVIRIRVCRDGGPQLIGRSLPPSINSITPNPAQDEIEIAYTSADDGLVELVAADGKVVAMVPARRTAATNGSVRLDLGSLSAGIYAVILRAGGGSTHQSVVVIP